VLDGKGTSRSCHEKFYDLCCPATVSAGVRAGPWFCMKPNRMSGTLFPASSAAPQHVRQGHPAGGPLWTIICTLPIRQGMSAHVAPHTKQSISIWQ
jgi:hypothetical protein